MFRTVREASRTAVRTASSQLSSEDATTSMTFAMSDMTRPFPSTPACNERSAAAGGE